MIMSADYVGVTLEEVAKFFERTWPIIEAELPTFLHRLGYEIVELDSRIAKLRRALFSDKLEIDQFGRDQLIRQLAAMELYFDALTTRFNKHSEDIAV